MTAEQRASLVAFFALLIASVVVLANAMRTDVVGGLFVAPAQSVVAGARLAPIPQRILAAGIAAVAPERDAPKTPATIVDQVVTHMVAVHAAGAVRGSATPGAGPTQHAGRGGDGSVLQQPVQAITSTLNDVAAGVTAGVVLTGTTQIVSTGTDGVVSTATSPAAAAAPVLVSSSAATATVSAASAAVQAIVPQAFSFGGGVDSATSVPTPTSTTATSSASSSRPARVSSGPRRPGSFRGPSTGHGLTPHRPAPSTTVTPSHTAPSFSAHVRPGHPPRSHGVDPGRLTDHRPPSQVQIGQGHPGAAHLGQGTGGRTHGGRSRGAPAAQQPAYVAPTAHGGYGMGHVSVKRGR